MAASLAAPAQPLFGWFTLAAFLEKWSSASSAAFFRGQARNTATRSGRGASRNRSGLFELESLEREQTIRFRDESSGLINILPREPDKLAYFESVMSSPDHTLSRKIRVTDVGKDVG